MTKRSANRAGWALLAVAAATLGGALAVQARKRKRTARPAPRGFVPAPVGPSGAERSLVRMAVGAAVVVVLAIVTVLAAKPSGDDGPAGPSQVLTGDGGARVEVTVHRPIRPLPDDVPGRRTEGLTLFVANIGAVPVVARLDRNGTWAVDANGVRYPAVAIGSPEPWAEPGGALEITVTVEVPVPTRLTRLRFAMSLGGEYQAVKLAL